MKHLRKGRQFGRKMGPKKALMKSLAKSFILHERIETTEAKAKELRSFVEKLITRSKVNNIHNYRLLIAKLGGQNVVEKLVKEIGPKYAERKGGYTRITKIGARPGDNAKMAIIELV